MASKKNNGLVLKKQYKKHYPLRTCIGCREKEEAHLLASVHYVATDVRNKAELVFDVRGTDGAQFSGRGAWLHYNVACFDRAVKRNAFSVSFKTRKQNIELLDPTLVDFENIIMLQKVGGKRMQTR